MPLHKFPKSSSCSSSQVESNFSSGCSLQTQRMDKTNSKQFTHCSIIYITASALAFRGEEYDSLSMKVRGITQTWRLEASCEIRSCDLKGQTGLSKATLSKVANTNHMDPEMVKMWLAQWFALYVWNLYKFSKTLYEK